MIWVLVFGVWFVLIGFGYILVKKKEKKIFPGRIHRVSFS